MYLLRALPVLCALTSSVSYAFPTSVSAPAADKFAKSSVVERLTGPPEGWVKDDAARFDKDAAVVKLRIHLVQQGMDRFHDMAMKIATPGHELYGQHLSQQVIDAMIAPKDESKELVMQWLENANMAKHATISERGDSVIVEASVKQVEELLSAKYTAFDDMESVHDLILAVKPSNGDSVVRTLKYALPDVLKGHVDMVQPTTFFGLRAMRSTISSVVHLDENRLSTDLAPGTEAVTGCTGSTITPKCLSNLYNFASATAAKSTGLMGIAGFLEQHPSPSDLQTFLKGYAVYNNVGQTYTCTLINGGTCPTTGTPGIEANLDVQYARAITKSIPNVFYSVGGRPPLVGGGTNTNEPYLEFLNYLLGLPAASLPNTISISYGDDESTVPLSYADNVCNLFSQLGAKGVSVLVASGDNGVGTTCKTGTAKTFTTSFPASCPWVTVVGGTTGNSPEGAWSGSGGGFSSVFGRPSYQNTAVSSWLTNDKTHVGVSSYFNSSGRAYPDVAAQSTNFLIYASGSAEGVSGTSAATPTFASVVQLLNTDRILAGKTGLGFLNPWLYSTATSGLTDIKTGKNTGCSGVISGAGFSAVSVSFVLDCYAMLCYG
ncbi:hypothetical protein MMC25_006592 [Agyrium rufum]|nr:hypothetical protein [Agyrium rufum]